MSISPYMRSTILVLPFLSSGCGDDIGSTASSIGHYIPVIDERCESAECITPSGKADSDAIKAYVYNLKTKSLTLLMTASEAKKEYLVFPD